MFDSAAKNKKTAEKVIGGIVPHAGWVFSGEVAAEVFQTIYETRDRIDTFVIFGACHSGLASETLVYGGDKWQTPIGEVEIDKELAEGLLENISNIKTDELIHSREHSIEVNVPFIKHKFPEAKILPIIMPVEGSSEAQAAISNYLLSQKGKEVAIIGSTDLTHYGRDYGFSPAGGGEQGVKWAKDVNDRELIDKIENFESEKALQHAIKNMSACGPSAISAAISVSKKLGASKASVLKHTNSSEIMEEKFGSPSTTAVGYAGVILVQ